LRREFGSDLLAGISIVTSVLLGEYLAGSLVVLMLSGGEALEAYAVRSASSILEALARRMPSRAHRKSNGKVVDIALHEVAKGDTLLVLPHEICPVDGTVLDGHGAMDESYLTGEPYIISKTPGSTVLSGAINGPSALTIRADKVAVDSRYAKIMEVMRASEQRRPRLRRLGDQLGAFYTHVAPTSSEAEVLTLVAGLERYSKHPLAEAILMAARQRQLAPPDASEIHEPPGQGLRGVVAGRKVVISSRKHVAAQQPLLAQELPAAAAGMECIILIDDRYAATLRFRDQPRKEGLSFIQHLKPKHLFDRVMIVSGDCESEVRYLAEQVGIREVYASQSPEQKVEIVRKESQQANTVFLGDGINDAPALTAATVGIAFGQNSDITTEAAGAVIMDTSLEKVDEFLHISRRLRTILLESAVGGMVLSLAGMAVAAAGYLPPVAGAIAQEIIDVLAVMNALRVAFPPRTLTDYRTSSPIG
jgi:cation transport ATPase